MQILIACDSFKDALSATAACKAIADGIRESGQNISVIEFPLADGGEGTVEVLTHHLELRAVQVPSVDPLFRSITASYGLSADGRTAVIEMAAASGLQLLTADERNALNTTTFGTGLLIADALRRGVQHLVMAIGGSATNDAGIGVAAALGWRFLDAQGHELKPVGASLMNIARVLPPKQSTAVQIDVMCDVTNPLHGPQGAAQVYARQKGANDAAIELLDAGLKNIARCVAADLQRGETADLPGAGAAGGLGFGAVSFLGARLRRGIELIMDLTQIDAAMQSSDLIITGEGHLDGQTLQGKLIHGICQRANRYSVPVVAFCGRLSASAAQLQAIGLRGAFSINETEQPLRQMLAHTAENLQRTARRLMSADPDATGRLQF